MIFHVIDFEGEPTARLFLFMMIFGKFFFKNKQPFGNTTHFRMEGRFF